MSILADDINTLLLPRYLLNDKYPYPEGIQLEFKKTFHVNQHAKYRETICAFLNTNGGHIIYGILDNCIINGCTLPEIEKDGILLFVDSIYNILKTTNGENIPKHKIKVYFEEIAKDVYIIIISCYRSKDDIEQYQFLRGESWIRMNASNMKTKYGKLYSVNDILLIKSKLHNKYTESTNRIKKNFASCEEDTIITVSNILINKTIREKELLSLPKNKYYLPYVFGITLFISLGINFNFLYKYLNV